LSGGIGKLYRRSLTARRLRRSASSEKRKTRCFGEHGIASWLLVRLIESQHLVAANTRCM
jgi:hypothetical protein